MQEWIIQFASSHQALIYLVIVFFGCIEGPILSMVSGVFIKLGYLSFFPAYIALMVGDLLGDIIWYQIGRLWGHKFISRFGKYVSVTEDGFEKVSKIFHRHKHSILFLSKISNGLGFALVTLVTAGIVKIPFWKYLSINLLGQFIWSGLLIGVGFYFSNMYLQVNSWLERVFIFAIFIVMIAVFLGSKKYLKNKLEKENL